MLELWQKGHWTWILEVVLLPPSRVTLDKSPSTAALRRPWPGGFLSTRGAHSHQALGCHRGCTGDWGCDPAGR